MNSTFTTVAQRLTAFDAGYFSSLSYAVKTVFVLISYVEFEFY